MKLPIDCLIDTNGFVRLVEKHHFQDFTIAHKLLDMAANGHVNLYRAEIVATAAVKGMIFFSFDYTTIKHVEIWGGIEDTLSEFNLSLENIRNQKFLEDVVKQSKKH